MDNIYAPSKVDPANHVDRGGLRIFALRKFPCRVVVAGRWPIAEHNNIIDNLHSTGFKAISGADNRIRMNRRYGFNLLWSFSFHSFKIDLVVIPRSEYVDIIARYNSWWHAWYDPMDNKKIVTDTVKLIGFSMA
jgi:hypothetical protein